MGRWGDVPETEREIVRKLEKKEKGR